MNELLRFKFVTYAVISQSFSVPKVIISRVPLAVVEVVPRFHTQILCKRMRIIHIDNGSVVSACSNVLFVEFKIVVENIVEVIDFLSAFSVETPQVPVRINHQFLIGFVELLLVIQRKSMKLSVIVTVSYLIKTSHAHRIDDIHVMNHVIIRRAVVSSTIVT